MVEGLDQMYEECQAADFNQVMKKVAQAYKVMPGELSNGTYTMQLGNEYGEWEDLTSFNQLKEACNEDGYTEVRRFESRSLQKKTMMMTWMNMMMIFQTMMKIINGIRMT